MRIMYIQFTDIFYCLEKYLYCFSKPWKIQGNLLHESGTEEN
jgi:hypothetical protein